MPLNISDQQANRRCLGSSLLHRGLIIHSSFTRGVIAGNNSHDVSDLDWSLLEATRVMSRSNSGVTGLLTAICTIAPGFAGLTTEKCETSIRA